MNQYLKKLKIILQFKYTYIFILFVTFFYVVIYIKNYVPIDIYNQMENEFELTIKEYKIDGDKLSISFNENLVGTYYFKSPEEKDEFKFNLNDKVYVKGDLNVPSNNSIFNMFNYKKYLYYKGILYSVLIDKIELRSRNDNFFYKVKNFVNNRIKKIDNEYLYAFILGETYYMDNDIYNNYKVNGVTHLFSLSALHVSVFSSIMYFFLKKIKVNEIFSLIVISLFLLFFSFISSFSISMLRALIFFILSSLNKIYKLNIKNINILYITLCILLFVNPNYIFDIGFKLSFLITYFIILFNKKNKLNNKLFSLTVISFISFLASLPLVINMSFEINIIGFISNIFFIPFVTYILFPLSLLTFIFSPLLIIFEYLSYFMELVSMFFSEYLNLTLVCHCLKFYEIIIYYIFLYFFIKNKLFIIFHFIYILYLFFFAYFDHNSYIYFIDVGQGDSSFIITENDINILIDTGGKYIYQKDMWKKRSKEYNLMLSSLIPFFKSIGIKKINYLVLSHGDYDHMGEAINLIENFKVEKVIFNCGEFNELEQKLLNILDKKKIPYYSCIKELNIDDNKLYFLQTKEYDNENDNSNVIYTELNGYKFMFMGDASTTTEKEIMNKYNLSDIDVLKVGHHGSKTSSGKEFIDDINLKYSVISVGKNNRYGHPNKEVLNTLEGSKIYRTDEDGSIMFKIKNNKLKIETCSP